MTSLFFLLYSSCVTLCLSFLSTHALIHRQCGFISNIPKWSMNMASRNPSADAGRQAARFAILLALSDAGPLFLLPTCMFAVLVRLRCVQIYYEKREEKRIVRFERHINPYRIPRAKLSPDSTLQSHQPTNDVVMMTANSPSTVGGKRSRPSSSLRETLRSAHYDNNAYDPTFDIIDDHK